MAKYVDILDENGKQLARCRLDGELVRCSGDPDLVKRLEEGIIVTLADGERRKFSPADGIAFLHALESYYDSPYMMASEIKEENQGGSLSP